MLNREEKVFVTVFFETYRDAVNATAIIMMPFMKAWFLASCRSCDKIAVFDHGQIVQTGGHEELLVEEGGKYAELWHAQAQFYEGG